MDLNQFESGLAQVIGRPSNLRPFVCEGSPLECEVFIVGYNPATAMDGDWWRYWKTGYGFQKDLWYADYLTARGGEASKSRMKIADFVNGLPNARVLEANIDARPSKRKSEYPRPVTAPFDYLLKTIKPTVILAHGVDAIRHLSGWQGALVESPHFIYVGRDKTVELLGAIRTGLDKETAP